MSNPREYYYSEIKKWIMAKDRLPQDREQVVRIQNAINDALLETEKLPNGELRLTAINDILFRRIRTYEGEALELHYEWHTIQNWIREFVNLVGKKAGY